MRSGKGVNRNPSANVSFLRKISNPENDVTCWSHDREGCPLQEEGTVANMWNWEVTPPPLSNSHRESLIEVGDK